MYFDFRGMMLLCPARYCRGMQITTQAQADTLNRTGEYGPYHAANGHTMIAPLRYPKSREWIDDGNDERAERDYRVGDEIRYDSWAAWCAPTCYACGMGEPLEDW